jgi:rhomboid family GlyGly-CTERM serine protease
VGERVSVSGNTTSRWWIAACAVLAVAAAALYLLPLRALDRLDWQPALAATEPWRWWTAALLHWNVLHLLANLAGLALLALLGREMRLPLQAVLAWLAAWPLAHLALLVRPDLQHYAGLSGLLHAGIAVAALWGVATLEPRTRRIAELLLAALFIKLLYEQPWDDAPAQAGGWGAPSAPLAHAAGALAGVVCASLALARGKPPRRVDPQAGRS